MAQQNINFGAFPNDSDADSIRAAFGRVQNNFTELYGVTLSTGVVSIIAGPGLSVNRATGNVTVSANIASLNLQAGNNMQIGIGNSYSDEQTISSGVTKLQVALKEIGRAHV